MQISFEKKEGYYRMNFSNYPIAKTEKKKNMSIYYDYQNKVVAIDFYPQQK